MNIDNLKKYCESKAGVVADFPFDFTTLVYKIGNKMFALIPQDEKVLKINLKCDPIKSIELRSKYSFITPGYHMNKKHWNTITIENNLHDKLIKELIDYSYELVYQNLSKRDKELISNNQL